MFPDHKYDIIKIKQLPDGAFSPDGPIPSRFIITAELLDVHCFEVREFTIRNLVTALLRNWAASLRGRLAIALYRRGFLAITEGERINFVKQFTVHGAAARRQAR